ncbi:MAG TPA: phosphoadenylyl-sulfate reductase [Deltaproteobacteria bacterium]|nr:MAG: phosphoadenosine phosphosulfate reductase [Deltaproteobacteria bacterium GWA2_55_82]OGQ63401.1 MAG: phosphoadenosine phosphosulfate reductase [Deltaproteobacteria bacterium RIFCSPLOWO2_02_FULL_55_12]OIJ73185.1 MAG: phosphoadenosine phosphosulfate reductase [Deltaproteobacteria bacterium GWC2_55_46]HBG45559.1 phosphoadenylyl-sulfate reductase [Deltaproteobacteria bacterium]HCY10390.1 phosphoadenylyl-sulfate reductase [Deltaproteobacteria bacterium]
MSKAWTEEELKKISDGLEGKAPEEAIRWAVENFATGELSLACSFGAEDVALMDMLTKIKPDARVFYLDTDLLFKESHEVKEKLMQRYGVTLEKYGAKTTLEEMAAEFGPELWKKEPDKCCNIRKMVPLAEALSGLKCWITGIRRDQAPTRANAPVVSWDAKFGLVKINPLVRWTSQDVWEYIRKNNVPYCSLHDKNYPSIGCEPCTRPVMPGDDPRAGRWAGFQKTECGLHK